MRRFEGITEELLTSIDVLNTLNGGVIEPKVTLSENKDYRQVEVFAPSVEEEQMKAEIHNNNLTIYYNIPVMSGERLIRLPKVVYNKQIPYFIDTKNIIAAFEDARFFVRLPFNELTSGYHRDLTAN